VASDTIHMRDLVVDCIIGTLPRERVMQQRIILNIAMGVDLQAAGVSDDLNDTVDYRSIKDQLVTELQASSYYLIEAVAEHVSRVCLARDGVSSVRVSVDKPGALTSTRSVAVEIVRDDS
jgi:FolB domain-containing protein